MNAFTVVDMLAISANNYPAKIAIKDEQKEITYEALRLKAELLGKYLLANGVSKGDRIGIFKENSVNTAIAIMGILSAGAAFVCINTKLKEKQVNHIIDDCGIKIIISNHQKIKYFFTHVKHASAKLMDVDVILNCADKDCLNIELPRIIDRDLASLVYTSGSTGKPKGVIFTHNEIVMNAKIMSELFKNTSDDNILCILPFSADYGLTLFYTMLFVGGRLTILNSFFPNDIVNMLGSESITGFSGITQIWPILFNEHSLFPTKELPALRYVTIGGGYPSKYIMEKIIAKLEGKTDIYTLYGLTEASWSTCLRPDKLKTKYGSIGTPIPNVEIFVSRNDQICGPNEEGELIHRGGVIAKGYWGNQEKTNEVFKHAVFLPEYLRKEEKVVYSGDIVVVDKEGYLYFKGRTDDLIKVQGYRICTEDLIDCIHETGMIETCCVFGAADADLGQKIIACVVPRSETADLQEKLLTHLKKELPGYMNPFKIFILKELPLTHSSKIDISLLKNLYKEDKLEEAVPSK